MAAEVQITVLCDNHEQDGLLAEHGFAVWMHSAELNLLFDTGSGETLNHNAEQLDIQLHDCQKVVLSHGHYDHSGGLNALWQLGIQCPVLAHPGVTLPRYSHHPLKPMRSIGMPAPVVTQLSDLPAQRRLWCPSAQRLTPYWGTSGEIPRQDPFEDVGGPFFLDVEGLVPDRIEDDQALWLNTPRGLVIVLGCCHSGIINTITHIRRQIGVDKVAGIIGGLHLLHADELRLDHTLDFLLQCQLDFLRPGHCTGDAVIERLKRLLPDVDVQLLHVGARYDIEVIPVAHHSFSHCST